MKIGLSTSVIQRGHSGVGQYVLSLVHALLPAAREHAFTLFVLEADLPLFGFAAAAMRIEPVAERHRPPVKNILWHQRTLPGLVRRAGLELLHVPSYRRMLWPRPCALVATIHDLAPFRLAGKYDWARTLYGRVVARQLAHRQDEIVAVSELTAGDIGTFFHVPPARVTVVPNGLDHARFQPGSAERARALVCRPRCIADPFFLYVARLEHPAKNHVRLIAAFNAFKAATGSAWKLVLAGSEWHGAAVVHAAINASPFARDIHRTGFVASSELPEWYRAAAVFVFPSQFEGFGLPPLEAMACGCPVLSSRRGALAGTVGPAAGLLEPDDVAQMQSQLTRAAGDPAWLDALRTSGLARAQEFNWQKTAASTLAVYARAHARRAPTRANPGSVAHRTPSASLHRA